MTSRIRGTLVTWKPDKAFGFIRPEQGGKDVFVHLRDFGSIGRPPRIGDLIQFQRVADGKGRYRAADVQVDGLQRNPESRAPRPTPRRATQRRSEGHGTGGFSLSPQVGVVITIVFACVLAGLAVFSALPIIVLPLYVAMSLVAFLLYAFDKAAAMNRRWRTTENTLLLVGLFGGWPGALLAQGMFRHKSRKVSFQLPFWLSVLVNCAVLAWLCTADGAGAVRALVY